MIYYGQAAISTLMSVSRPQEALQEQVESAVHILQSGGVVAIPTDTLYGLAACSINDGAVRRVFRLKGRSTQQALPLLLAEADDITRWARNIPEISWALADRFWPGALTLVLPKADSVPDVVSGGTDTIALRVPDHRMARAIARGLRAPITGTSANRSGRSGLTTAKAVRDEFGDEIDLVIDGGELIGGLASTVLDLSGERPRILRQGAISRREIEELCKVG